MIRFLYRGGSEEARQWLTDSIRCDLEAGAEVLLLVPEQETVSVERRMLEILPPACQLSFEVLNFSRLANRVFRALGGLSYRNATPAVSTLLMWRTVREVAPLLRQYGAGGARDSALCELMLKTEAQCKTGCVEAEALLEAAEGLREGEPLRDKLHDIGLTLSTYEKHFSDRFDNAADDLNRLAALLEHRGKELLAKTHIYVHSFTDFTAQEIRVLRALMAIVPTLTVSLQLEKPSDEALHLYAVRHTQSTLKRKAEELGLSVHTVYPPEAKAFDASDDEARLCHAAISYFSRHLFDMAAEKAPLQLSACGGIRLTACGTPFDEATAIAAEIHRLVRLGYRYRDITVVVREASDWLGILDATLEKEGIPCFISEKTDVTVRPLIKLILEALRIHTGGWREEDVIGYLKTGLTGVSADDINCFEAYLGVWHPRGDAAFLTPFTKNPDGFSKTRSARAERILEGANRAREQLVPPLCALFEALRQAQSAADLSNAVYDLLQRLDIRRQLKEEAERRLQNGERREAEELSRLYNVTVDALEAIPTALNDMTPALTPADLADVLKLVFSGTDIGSIPTSADEVTVGSASMLRADRPQFVLIPGLNEGIFPRTVSDSGLLSEADKRQLAELDIVFPVTGKKLASDEMFFLYRAVSAPQRGLWLSYAQNGCDGRSLTPSLAVTRLQTLFPTLPKKIFAAASPLDRIYTHSGAIEALSELPPATAEALLSHLEKENVRTAKSLRRPVVDTAAAVSADLAAELFSNADYSPTQLERFAGCRFLYYCRHILDLREEPSGKMTAREVGNFIHFVLEHVLGRIDPKSPRFVLDEAEQETLVTELCEKYREKLVEIGGERNPRTDALLDRLTTLSKLVVRGLMTEFADSDFRPAFLELNLQKTGGRPTVQMGDTTVALNGKVDRVDYWLDSAKRPYLRVIDYKTGHKEFSLSDIKRGFSIQMPLYLYALCKGTHPLLARQLELPADTAFHPAGVTYFSSSVGSEATEQRKEATDALADAVERLERNGVVLNAPSVLNAISHSGDKAILGSEGKRLSADDFDEMFTALEATVSELAAAMRSGAAEAHPNCAGKSSPCTYCPYGAICRAAKKEKSFG